MPHVPLARSKPQTSATFSKWSYGRKTICASPAAARRQPYRQSRTIFAAAIRHRPRGRYTIRQRRRVVEQWPALAEK
jgi:hypothetical protein